MTFGMSFPQPLPCLPPGGSLAVIILARALLFFSLSLSFLFFFFYLMRSVAHTTAIFLISPKLFSVFVAKLLLPSLLNFHEAVVETVS